MDKNRYPHMVHEYFVNRVRTKMDERRQRLSNLKTKEDAEEYVAYVRNAIQKSFGEFPEKCDLNATITGTHDAGEYRIESVVYESRPGFMVTGNLYIPKDVKDNAPGVLGVCGHSQNGKAEPAYQSYAIALVLKGFMVFVIDPISQGERWQHAAPEKAPAPGLCHAHNLMGNQQILVDDFFGSWRVWDAIRGLDYLLSRAEVDSTRIGVTGNSGGGTLSSYVTALDSRVTMAAPSCYICSWEANMENEIPSDAEQNPPGLLVAGLDEVDLLIAYAPRPTIILAQHYDFFDERFAKRASEEAKKVFELLGCADNLDYFAGPCEHGFSVENREAMVAFFMKHAGIEGDSKEPEIEPLAEDKLFATENGNTLKAGSRSVFDFTRERAATFAAKRKEENIVDVCIKNLGITMATEAPHYRVLYAYPMTNSHDGMVGQFAVETEPGIQTIVSVFGDKHPLMRIPKGDGAVYIGHIDGYDDIQSIPRINKLLQDYSYVFVVDPRGIGQSRARTCSGNNDFFNPYGSDYMYSVYYEMFGESYTGKRVYDVLRVLDLLYSLDNRKLTVVGRGMGAIYAAFAGLLHNKQPDVELINYLPDYKTIIDSEVYRWPLSSFVRGILKHVDLPDVYNALGSRLKKSAPWDEMMDSK